MYLTEVNDLSGPTVYTVSAACGGQGFDSRWDQLEAMNFCNGSGLGKLVEPRREFLCFGTHNNSLVLDQVTWFSYLLQYINYHRRSGRLPPPVVMTSTMVEQCTPRSTYPHVCLPFALYVLPSAFHMFVM